ncbi:sigma-70 family RNA polymerase sigma factor [Candidatus Poribacteria bacterium]|nr:sigma-70 family RNA polymerase sigma factor [Candidatus Poribacteria bacterium]
MVNDNVELIHRILSGEDEAFSVLVRKYQRRVHALIWRKIGDFHIAEEITQDAFLQAYKKLSTLKNPKLFDGWLYVIANRLCLNWIQRNKPAIHQQSIENTPIEEIEKSSYANYESEHREIEAAEHQREIVKNLLEQLPESERTVVTLHYLGEMTCKAIGEFLGVSANTVKSRLQRARNRLKEQENMIRETLGSVQLPANFTENIMRQAAEIKPVAPTSSKPLVPWAASAATAIFIFLIMGVGSEYLARFQNPYNVNAHSETTIEIIDAPIVLDIQAKRDLRNQAGRFETDDKRGGIGPQASEPFVLAAATEVADQKSTSTKQQWMQASGPEGVSILGFLASAKGDVYATSPIGIYRLTPDKETWTLVNGSVTNGQLYPMPMAEQGDRLYIVSVKEVLSSTDRGKTWHTLGSRPEGKAKGLIVTEEAFYLVTDKKGVFRSTDAGKQWTAFNDGFKFDAETSAPKITTVTSIGNTVFVLTDLDLYRLHSDRWEKLPIEPPNIFDSFDSSAASGNDLYVAACHDYSRMKIKPSELKVDAAEVKAHLASIKSGKTRWTLFRSTDLGNSWVEITPQNAPFTMRQAIDIKLIAAGETLLVAGGRYGMRSRDDGQTWTALGEIPYTPSYTPDAGINDNTFYAGKYEVYRTTNGGESWHPFMRGMIGTQMRNLVAFKNGLYVHNDWKIVKSTDSGETWTPVNFRAGWNSPRDPDFPNQRLVVADDVPYGVFLEKNKRGIFGSPTIRKSKLRIFQLSADGNTLMPVKGLPSLEFDDELHSKDLSAGEVTLGELAVSDKTFYIEYRRELFKCKPGTLKWQSTGLTDSGKQPANSRKGFQLAVSGKTIYVGMRDGKLFQSFDEGTTWKDVTPNLPLQFKRFKEITFVGSSVYVSTDKGVLTSQNGEHWRVLTDTEGERLIVASLAVDDTTVYGVCNAGAYRLDNHGKWKKVSPEVPDGIRELVFANNKLYIITNKRGMFHVSLGNEKG